MIKTHTGNEGIRDVNSELIYGINIRNSLRAQAITVGTSATLLPTTPLSRRFTLLVMNNSTSGQVLYIGASDVTTAQGFPIYPRGALLINAEDEVNVYGIASASGAAIRLLEGA